MLKETVIVQVKVPETYEYDSTNDTSKLFSSKYSQEAQKGLCQASLGSGRVSERNSKI